MSDSVEMIPSDYLARVAALRAGRAPRRRPVGARARMEPMPLYRDEAVVLRTQKLGEADRMVTLLPRRHGRVRAVAKGVRRTGSRFGARVEPFMQVDLQLHEGRSLDTVTQAETIAPFGERIGPPSGRHTPRPP